MKVLFVSSEIYPLAKTGGLADVSAALPRALAELGVDVHLVLPGYAPALAEAADKTVEAELPGPSGESMTRLITARMPDSGLPVHIVDCPSLFQREGAFYQDPEGRDWPDNAQRFAHFTRVAAAIATGELIAGWRAAVVHANDWHTGLLPLLLGDEIEHRPRTLFTIHNLAFQGLFAAATAGALGLPENLLTLDGIEFHGRISFLKAGIRYSDRLTTVSPNYAREILTAEHGGTDAEKIAAASRAAGTPAADEARLDRRTRSLLAELRFHLPGCNPVHIPQRHQIGAAGFLHRRHRDAVLLWLRVRIS
jgi:starch synthase